MRVLTKNLPITSPGAALATFLALVVNVGAGALLVPLPVAIVLAAAATVPFGILHNWIADCVSHGCARRAAFVAQAALIYGVAAGAIAFVWYWGATMTW